jgi:hypothetical protein
MADDRAPRPAAVSTMITAAAPASGGAKTCDVRQPRDGARRANGAQRRIAPICVGPTERRLGRRSRHRPKPLRIGLPPMRRPGEPDHPDACAVGGVVGLAIAEISVAAIGHAS